MATKTKGALSSKTVYFGMALIVLAALQQTDLAQLVPAQYLPLATAAIGCAVLWLRWQTNTAITLTPPVTEPKPGEGEG